MLIETKLFVLFWAVVIVCAAITTKLYYRRQHKAMAAELKADRQYIRKLKKNEYKRLHNDFEYLGVRYGEYSNKSNA